MKTNGIESPADEEEEEELVDQSSGDEAPPPAFGLRVAEEPQPLQPETVAMATLQLAAAGPQQTAALQQTAADDSAAADDTTLDGAAADGAAADGTAAAPQQMAPLQQMAPPVPHPEALARPQQQLLLRAPQQPVALAAQEPATSATQEAVFQYKPPHGVRPYLARSPPASVPELPRLGLLKRPRTNSSRHESGPPDAWPPSDKRYNQCDPPCIEGRGICNDNVCFCKSPFAGSTCQHKQMGLYRAPQIMVVGFATVCLVMGILLSKFVFSFCEQAVETRLEFYGSNKRKAERWSPPAEEKDKKGVLSARQTEAGL